MFSVLSNCLSRLWVIEIFTQYKIIQCPHCGLIQYVKEGQKTRMCPNQRCRKSINLERVIVFTTTFDIQKAVRIVQNLKEKKATAQDSFKIRPVLDEENSL